MLRDITIGQYYPADSVLHKMDPRTKLMATMIYILSLFVFRNLAGFAAVTAGLLAVILLSKVPVGYMVKGLRAIIVILVITAVFNLFLTPGEPLAAFWVFKITEEGLKNACLMTVRLIYLILGSSVLTLTTTPNQLTDGLEKAKSMVPLLVPLFISAFRRANDLALAMEARCYHGGQGRTKMKPLKYKKADGIAYLAALGYFAAVILLRRFL